MLEAITAEERASLLDDDASPAGESLPTTPPWPDTTQQRLLAVMRDAVDEFRGKLRPLVRVEVAGNVEDPRSADCRRWLSGLSGPTCLVRIVRPFDQSQAFLEIGLDILQPILDRMLGSNEPPVIDRRPLTELEQRLAGRIVQLWLEALQSVWPSSSDGWLTLAGFENQPRSIAGLPAASAYVVSRCELRMRTQCGAIHWTFPQHWLDELVLGDTVSEASPESQFIDLTVELDGACLDAAELASLEAGDIITTDHGLNQPLRVRTSDGREFTAVAGSRQGRKAIRIDQVIALPSKASPSE